MNNYPTWEDFNLPLRFVKELRDIRVSKEITQLVLDKVFHCKKKIHTTYTCAACRSKYSTHRIYEDYSMCAHCGCNCISADFSLSLSKNDTKEISFSIEKEDLKSLIRQMKNNFFSYFSSPPKEDFVDFGWNELHDKFYCQFVAGELVFANRSSDAVIKSALLCPYLWDHKFDWNTGRIEPSKELESSISPDINRILQSMMR